MLSCPHFLSCVFTVQSLDWETFEQYSTWQLFLAHSIPLETIIPILQHLKYKGDVHKVSPGHGLQTSDGSCCLLSTEHPEALSCLLLQLRKEKYATVGTHRPRAPPVPDLSVCLSQTQ